MNSCTAASWLRLRIILSWLSASLAWARSDCVAAGAPDPAPAVLRGIVTDARTGLPAACTVTLRGADGALVLESPAFQGGFRCDGRFEKSLPPGRALLRITRGPETRVEERELRLAAGEVREIRIGLERVVDLRRRGWFAGDSHVHMIHGERTIPVSFSDIALAARAEDLQYVSVSHAWSMENATPERLSEELARHSLPDGVLTWNLEAPKNYYHGDAGRCLGHCWTLGMRGRTEAGFDVIRLLLDASAHDYESDKPTFANFESHRLIRDQGGMVFYSHPLRWWTGPWGGRGGYPKVEAMRVSNMAVELPLDTVAGPTYDGVDVITGGNEFKGFDLWAFLLNRGYRLAAVASSDACFDRPGGATPGMSRTYTHLDGPFSISAVARATAQGKTVATTGPLLLATIDHQPPGTAFVADGKARILAVEAWAEGGEPGGLSRVEILRNGAVLHRFSCEPSAHMWQTNLPLRVSDSAWYCVRAIGGGGDRERAITGAFAFDAPGASAPKPVQARIQARLMDARTGQSLTGTLVEVLYQATLARDGALRCRINGEAALTIPGTSRLRAESSGYHPQILSPFLDNPELVDFITKREEKDLLDWRTYERIQEMLANVQLTFRLERQ